MPNDHNREAAANLQKAIRNLKIATVFVWIALVCALARVVF